MKFITGHKRSLVQGNVFTGVYLCTGGGDLPTRGGLTGGGGDCIQGALGRPPRNQKSGRYASYWNAYLFIENEQRYGGDLLLVLQDSQ